MKKKVKCNCCKSTFVANVCERSFKTYDIEKQEMVDRPYYFFVCPTCQCKTEFLEEKDVAC